MKMTKSPFPAFACCLKGLKVIRLDKMQHNKKVMHKAKWKDYESGNVFKREDIIDVTCEEKKKIENIYTSPLSWVH